MILIEIWEQLQKFPSWSKNSDSTGCSGRDVQNIQTLQNNILTSAIRIRFGLENHRRKIRNLLPVWRPKERLNKFFFRCNHLSQVIRLNNM